MFDFHNHFTNEHSCKVTADLLPQNYKGQLINTCIGKSEIGLDKRFVSIMNKEKQIELFKQCLFSAKQKNIPIHVHCVGFVNDCINCLKEANLPKKTVLWHKFNESYETAAVLYKLGILVSISNNYNKDIKKLYDSNPLLVLETDYEGTNGLEHQMLIRQNYIKTANALSLNLDQLEEIVLDAGKAFTDIGFTGQ